MWQITKHFDFCYGHRVHTQELDAELSCNSPCKCRHLHGHQGKLEISLSANRLNNGMVTDFHHLNWVKPWIDQYFDHKMILDKKDPYLKSLLKGIGIASDVQIFKEVNPLLGENKNPFVTFHTTEKALGKILPNLKLKTYSF